MCSKKSEIKRCEEIVENHLRENNIKLLPPKKRKQPTTVGEYKPDKS